MSTLLYLAARKIGGESAGMLPRPKIVTVLDHELRDVYRDTKNGGSVIKTVRSDMQTLLVYESPRMVDVAMNLSNTTNPFTLNKKADVAGHHTTQAGTTTIMVNYINAIATATAGSAEASKFAAAVVGNVRVVINNTAVPISIFPASNGYINAAAQNAKVTLAAYGMAIFVCKETAKWVTAEGSDIS